MMANNDVKLNNFPISNNIYSKKNSFYLKMPKIIAKKSS